MGAIAFLISFLLAALLTPAVIWLYRRNGWIEDPQKQKHVKITHQQPLPRGGGLVIFTAIIIGAMLFLNIDKYLFAILLAAGLLTVVGFLDDLYNIHPFWRLFAGGVAALIVAGAGIGIAYVSNPFAPGIIHLDHPQLSFIFLGRLRSIWVLSDLVALLFIVWNMNIVNWSKGVDGQMPGFVAIAAVFVGMVAGRFAADPTQFNVQVLAFLVAGAFAGFLLWNVYPQKILPGYGAGSLAGFFLAVLAILSGAKLATTIMVLAIPTADALFTISRRLLAGKLPWWGDRGHLHHKLLDVFGWGRRRIAVFYWSTTLIMGILSLALGTSGKIISVAVVTSLVFGLLIWVKIHGQDTR